MLIDRCANYWNNFFISLCDSTDGNFLFEKTNLAEFRKYWLDKEFAIRCLRRSKRFVDHQSILERVISWVSSVPSQSSVPFYEIEELSLLKDFAITF